MIFVFFIVVKKCRYRGLIVLFEALFDFFSEILEQVQLPLVFFPFPYKQFFSQQQYGVVPQPVFDDSSFRASFFPALCDGHIQQLGFVGKVRLTFFR